MVEIARELKNYSEYFCVEYYLLIKHSGDEKEAQKINVLNRYFPEKIARLLNLENEDEIKEVYKRSQQRIKKELAVLNAQWKEGYITIPKRKEVVKKVHQLIVSEVERILKEAKRLKKLEKTFVSNPTKPKKTEEKSSFSSSSFFDDDDGTDLLLEALREEEDRGIGKKSVKNFRSSRKNKPYL